MQQRLLHLLPFGLVLVDAAHRLTYLNTAAEMLLGGSMAALASHPIHTFLTSPLNLASRIDAVIATRMPIREHDFLFSVGRTGSRRMTLYALPTDDAAQVMLIFDEYGVADRLSPHFIHQSHARAQSAMASILAHEVKNPLSGIKGAAQLLRETVSEEDRSLTGLICDEVDRIRDVIGEIETLSESSDIPSEPVNIHEVLHYVRALLEKGDAAGVSFHERFDPSLPSVAGHRNPLIQLFLNLGKNAAEALSGVEQPAIIFSTSYRSGVRFRREGAEKPTSLSILVTIEDNGPGIPESLQDSLFDPFVTTKAAGKGLGLAIVSKIVSDHGGVIELDRERTQGTRFHVSLPEHTASLGRAAIIG